MDPAQEDIQDALQQVYDSLTNAYWAASSIEDKDRLRGCADALFEVLSQIKADEIKARSAKFEQLKESFQPVSASLAKLQNEINSVVHNVQVAGKLAGSITRALNAAARFFI